MSKRTIYLSVDVEADGPIPGPFSMLQFGVAAFDPLAAAPRTPIATFEANLGLLPDASQDEGTMEWWAKHQEAYDSTRTNLQSPETAMTAFVQWVKDLPGHPVVIGYPVTYDFMFLYWYTMAFGTKPRERCPFGFQGLDIKTLAWTRLGGEYRRATKRNMPKRWFDGCPEHTHDGLDDAIGQGVLFLNIVKEPSR